MQKADDMKFQRMHANGLVEGRSEVGLMVSRPFGHLPGGGS